MMNRNLAQTCLALAFAWSCGNEELKSPRSLPSEVWAPGVFDQDLETVVGSVTHGGSENLTLWHALEVERLRVAPPAILGDFRDALLVSTLSHFFVELPATEEPRKLITAVRRTQAHENKALHCEVFWTENQTLSSLIKLDLPATPNLVSEPWHELVVDLPVSAGRLEFVSRDPIPSGEQSEPIYVAWQSPWVGPSATPKTFVESNQGIPNSHPPDVLLLTIDTFRNDALAHAPNLNAILEEGALWPEAISPSNWTLPSYASLFSGRSPMEHGAGRGKFAAEATGEMEERDLTPMNPGIPSLPQLFREVGYATAMFHQSPMLESWTGLAAGFDRYTRMNNNAEIALKKAEQWWNANANRPRFLVVHLMAPHLPYRFGLEPDPLEKLDLVNFFQEDHTPTERQNFFSLPGAEKQIVKDRYYEEVRRVDLQLAPFLGKILNSPDQAANVIFAFHSDHGEELWDAGSFEHGHSFDMSVIKVPVGLRWPGHIPPSIQRVPVPAHGLGASLLTASGIVHDWQLNLESPPPKLESSMPFYRSETGGKHFFNGEVTDKPFLYQMNSGGQQAAITADKLRMLEELGYLASRDLVPNNQEAGDK